MAWRLDRGLAVLIAEWRARNPGAVVGTIADEHHKPPSDHLPDDADTVDAGDFMPGPTVSEAELDAFAERLRLSRDRRIAYVIRRDRIFSSTNDPWTWRSYSGAYHGHTHVSINERHADDTTPWRLYPMTPAEFLAAFLAAMQNTEFRTQFAALLKSEPVNFQLRKAPWAYAGAPLPVDQSMVAWTVNENQEVRDALAVLDDRATELLDRPSTVVLSAEDRALIVAELVSAVGGTIAETVATAIAGVEFAPRPNTQ